MSEDQTKSTSKLANQVVEVVKTANDLLQEQTALLEDANSKVAEYDADTKAAQAIVVGVIEKLASNRVDNEFLIPPEQKQMWLDAVTTKRGFAEVADQLTDYVISKKPTATKEASDLGEVADTAPSTETPATRTRRSYF